MTLNSMERELKLLRGNRTLQTGIKRWTVLKVCTGWDPIPISILRVCVLQSRCCVFYRAFLLTYSHVLSWLLFLAPICRWWRFLTDHTAVLGFAVYFCDGTAHTSQMGQTISVNWVKYTFKFFFSIPPHPISFRQRNIYSRRRKSFRRQWLWSTGDESHKLWCSLSH